MLRRTWEGLLDAQENWNYTFAKVANQLALPRDPSRIPLVSVLFNIDPPMAKVNFSALKHRFVPGPRHYFQFDLGFNLVEEDGGLRVECDFNRHLFDRDSIQAWLDCYFVLLRHIVSNADQPVGRIPMVADFNVSQTQSSNGNTAVTLQGLIERQVLRTPNARPRAVVRC